MKLATFFLLIIISFTSNACDEDDDCCDKNRTRDLKVREIR